MSRNKKTDAEKAVRKSVSIEVDTLLRALEKSKIEYRGNLSFYINNLIDNDTKNVEVSEKQREEFIKSLNKETKDDKKETAKTEVKKEEPIQMPVVKKNSFRLSAIDSVMSMGED